jgi:hypothetical protein
VLYEVVESFLILKVLRETRRVHCAAAVRNAYVIFRQEISLLVQLDVQPLTLETKSCRLSATSRNVKICRLIWGVADFKRIIKYTQQRWAGTKHIVSTHLTLHVRFDHLCTCPVYTTLRVFPVGASKRFVEETAPCLVFEIRVTTGIELVWACLLLFLWFQFRVLLCLQRECVFCWSLVFASVYIIFLTFFIKYSLPSVQIKIVLLSRRLQSLVCI